MAGVTLINEVISLTDTIPEILKPYYVWTASSPRETLANWTEETEW